MIHGVNQSLEVINGGAFKTLNPPKIIIIIIIIIIIWQLEVG
jgi:hypothetical protein